MLALTRLLVCLILWLSGSILQKPEVWQSLGEGLWYGAFQASVTSTHSDSRISVLKIDPTHYSFFLTCATQKENAFTPHPLDEWCRTKKFVAAINAGMFDGYDQTQPSHTYLCNRGYMQTYGHINSHQVTHDNAVVCFDPKNDTLPAFQVADIRNCTTLPMLRKQYHTLIQGIRMVSCQGKNCWKSDQKRWSVCAIGMDIDGNALFIHSRSPYTMHVFTEMLLKLPLHLKSLMYLEGGPEASLYVSAAGTTIRRFGSYETGFNENDTNDHYWNLPNVIGIRAR